MDDIVAFLDQWLSANYDETSYSDIKPVTVRRARDEIVALRKGVASGGWVWEQLQMTHKAARAEAEDAYRYLRRVFEICAPECTPLPDLMGLCTQIDNLIAGYRNAET